MRGKRNLTGKSRKSLSFFLYRRSLHARGPFLVYFSSEYRSFFILQYDGLFLPKLTFSEGPHGALVTRELKSSLTLFGRSLFPCYLSDSFLWYTIFSLWVRLRLQPEPPMLLRVHDLTRSSLVIISISVVLLYIYLSISISFFLSPSVIVYKTLSTPHIEYCPQTWTPASIDGNWRVI